GWAEGLLDSPRLRQATVLEEAELWQLPIAEFLEILAGSPMLMLSALGSAVHRSTSTHRMRSELRGRSAYQRVSYVVRQLTREAYGANDQDPRPIHITHDEIARVCELSRQTVTKALGEMQRKGLVRLGLRSIEVIGRQRLLEGADGMD